MRSVKLVRTALWNPLALVVAVLLVAGGSTAVAGEELKVRAQLIWGTDEARPKDSGYKELDPELRQKLARIFKWKNYWQISEQKCGFRAGETKKLKMSAKCEIELRHLDNATIEIKLYGEGKLTRTVKQSIKVLEKGELTVLAGDDKDNQNDAWFVVITAPK